jgi:hypothetical protein
MTATIFVEAYARPLLTDLQRAIDDRERDRFTSAYNASTGRVLRLPSGGGEALSASASSTPLVVTFHFT